MSDETAFLAAIKASPADDAPRLVYADWLDEQGRADQAEFIRLEATHRRTRARLEVLEDQVDPGWVAQVFPENRLVLKSYPQHRKIWVIKLLRELTGLGLAEAKEMSERLPCVVGKPFPFRELDRFRKQFEEIEAEVELRYAVK